MKGNKKKVFSTKDVIELFTKAGLEFKTTLRVNWYIYCSYKSVSLLSFHFLLVRVHEVSQSVFIFSFLFVGRYRIYHGEE